MNYVKQVYGEMRRQPLAVWLSVGGTALSIFLVMAVFMINDLPNVETKPEINRKSMLVGHGVHLTEKWENFNNESSFMSLSKQFAGKIYSDIEGIERISYTSALSEEGANAPGMLPETFNVRYTDNAFWTMFDFDFIAGKPYSQAESDAGVKAVVVSETLARKLFNTADVVGREIQMNYTPYRICGVIKDVNPLFTLAYADIYGTLGSSVHTANWWHNEEDWKWEYSGNVYVLLLKKKGTDNEAIKSQVEARYDAINKQLEKDHRGIVYHGQPYDMEELASPHGSNTTPDVKARRPYLWTIYGILLLIPAINLSGMSRSRLSRRVSEIGVRRAFGATRVSIINQLLGENFLITLLGGVIGLLLCVVFIFFLADMFIDLEKYVGTNISAKPTFSMLFTWKAFGFAVLFCALLNLLSTGLPVWKASSINPAEAISGNDNITK